MVDEAPDRKTRIERRIEKLIQDFDRYVRWYDRYTPFNKPDQLSFHVTTIRRRRELGSAALAATDSQFCRSLYRTLQSWGIGQRMSRLIAYDAFAERIASRAKEFSNFDRFAIDDPTLDIDRTAEEVWLLIDSLKIVENISKLVPSTKALHHLLPDLVAPVDREYTQTFFGLHNPEFQGQYGSQKPVFIQTFTTFSLIAREVTLGRYVGTGEPWRTSKSKVIDNALVGFCKAERLSKTT
jgi:hypothetical protein